MRNTLLMLLGISTSIYSLDSHGQVVGKYVTLGPDKVVSVKVDDVKKTINAKLSDYITDLEIIPLENSQKALTDGYHITVSDSYIGVYGSSNSPFKLFDRKTGKHIATCGNIGRGPNEYFAVYSAQIDQAANRIYLLPWHMNKILVYDLTGKAFDPIPTPWAMPKGQLRVDGVKKRVIVAALPFKGGPKSMVWEQDFTGKVLSQVSAKQFELNADFSHEILSGNNTPTFDISLISLNIRPDTLYNYETGRLKPVFTLDFKSEENRPIYSYLELPKTFMASISQKSTTDGNNYVADKTRWLAVDKKSLEATWIKITDDLLGASLEWLPFSGGYYVQNIEPTLLLEQIEKAVTKGGLHMDAGKYIDLIKKRVTEDGNNVVIIGKLRK